MRAFPAAGAGPNAGGVPSRAAGGRLFDRQRPLPPVRPGGIDGKAALAGRLPCRCVFPGRLPGAGDGRRLQDRPVAGPLPAAQGTGGPAGVCPRLPPKLLGPGRKGCRPRENEVGRWMRPVGILPVDRSKKIKTAGARLPGPASPCGPFLLGRQRDPSVALLEACE